jgi:multidrug efflux system membrane fusion protein
LIDDRKGVVLIPTAAIQRGIQSANYVYVVKETPSKKDPAKMEQTVALQNIATGPTEGEDTIIDSGLNDGDIVVTDGVDKLQPGSRVSIPEGRKPAVKVKS